MIAVEGWVEPKPALGREVGGHDDVGYEEVVVEAGADEAVSEVLADEGVGAVAGEQPVGLQAVVAFWGLYF